MTAVGKSKDHLLVSIYDGIYCSKDGENWKRATYNLYVSSFWNAGDVVYAAASPNLLASSDGGRSWKVKNWPDYALGFQSVIGDGVRMYATTSSGVYLSKDEGVTWEAANFGLPGITPLATGLAVLDSTVFVVVLPTDDFTGGVYYSTNRGLTWKATLLKDIYIYELKAIGGTLYAGGYGLLYSSKNGGRSWSKETKGLAHSGIVEGIFSENNTLYASVRGQGLYASMDSGATWTETSLRDNGIESATVFGGHIFALTREGRGILKTESGREDWKPANTGLPSTLRIRNTVACNGEVSMLAFELFMHSPDGGKTWQHNNVPGMRGYISAIAATDSRLIACDSSGRVHFRTADKQWHTSETVLENPKVITMAASRTMVVAGAVNDFPSPYKSTLFVSIDNGDTWMPTNIKETIRLLAVQNRTIFVVVDEPGLRHFYVSRDNGINWSQMQSGLSLDHRTVSLVASDSTLLAYAYPSQVYISRDSGLNWRPVTIADGVDDFTGIVEKNGYIVISTNKGIFFSADKGTTWTAANTGLQADVSISSLTADRDNFYAGTTKGVWQRPLLDILPASVWESAMNSPCAVYPNPCTLYTVIEPGDGRVLAGATLRVYDILGNEVRQQTDLYGDRIYVQRGALPAGAYVFSIEEKGKLVSAGRFFVSESSPAR